MIPRAVVPGTGLAVSRLVLGTVPLHIDRYEDAARLLDTFWGLGGNAFDLAHIYNDGGGHRALGRWLRERGVRDEAVLYDKGCHPYGSPRVTPGHIEADLLEDLERLGLSHVEFWAFHRDDPAVPVGPLVDKLDELKRRGLVRHWGASNWTVGRVQEFDAYAAQTGRQGFAVNNPNLSLATVNEPMWADCHTLTAEERAWHTQTQFPLFSWSSTGGGWFAHVETADVTRVYANDENRARRERAEVLGKKVGATGNQVALAWTLAQPFPVWALVGPADPDQLRANAEATHITLSPADLRWLETGE
ncbi:MAG: aldo/keto reductase [Fimbriimonadaceae bacterium]|nr:aldo/keto reductase [Fimbriimonadaceae bacterium]